METLANLTSLAIRQFKLFMASSRPAKGMNHWLLAHHTTSSQMVLQQKRTTFEAVCSTEHILSCHLCRASREGNSECTSHVHINSTCSSTFSCGAERSPRKNVN